MSCFATTLPPSNTVVDIRRPPTTSYGETERQVRRRLSFRLLHPGPITEAAMRDLIGWYNDISRRMPGLLLLPLSVSFAFLQFILSKTETEESPGDSSS